MGGDEEVGRGSGRGAGRADVEELVRAARLLGSCEPPAAPSLWKGREPRHACRSAVGATAGTAPGPGAASRAGGPPRPGLSL